MLETRSAEESVLETKEDMLIAGYALVFDSPTLIGSVNGANYYEVINKTALDNCDLSDIVLRYNHNDKNTLLARTANNTLTVKVDDVGLYIEAKIANTSIGRDIYELIKRGDISKMSFGFIVDKDTYKANIRYIDSIKSIKEVSVVDFPAYDDTSVQAIYRNFDNARIEAETKHFREVLKAVLLSD
jgi:phage prohead protease, HK97 family|nr:MAG TPA: prohead serine protease [Caudoviricetes sp.]